MMFPITIVMHFLLLLWVSNAQADISLTLRKQQYLPPPIQELPINEQYFNTEQQQRFEGNSYENSRYQIFEVHNHYETSKGGAGSTQKSLDKQKIFANNNYKNSAKKIFIEHVNTPGDFPIDDPNLDASYLSFVGGNDNSQHQIFVQHERKNNIPDPFSSNFHHTLPENVYKESNLNTVPQSFSSNHHKQRYDSYDHHNQRYDSSKFRGPDYLPPISQAQQYFTHQEQNSLTAQDYQTIQLRDNLSGFERSLKIPDYSSHEIVNDNKVTSQGPDFLPSQQQKSFLTHQNSEYKGTDYLPPHQQSREEVLQSFTPSVAFKGPDYLPPQQLSAQYNENMKQNSVERSSNYERHYQPGSYRFEQSFTPKSQFKSPDYLPPQNDFQTPPQGQNMQFRPSKQFKGPEYLPPVNSQELEQSIENLQPQQETSNSKNHLKGPDYLPPQQSLSKVPFKGPEFFPPIINQLQQNLPTGYDFQKPPNAEQAIAELHKLPEESLPNAEMSNENYGAAKQKEFNSNNNNLPSGYDFKKPDNSEQAIKLLHSQDTSTPSSTQFNKATERSLPNYHFQKTLNDQNIENQIRNFDSYQDFKSLQKVPAQNKQKRNEATNIRDQTQAKQFSQSTLQTFKGPDYLPPSKGSQNFKGLEYLPPSSEYTPSKKLDNTSGQAAFKGPEYLPPTTGTQNYKGPDYLPPFNFQRIAVSAIKPENSEVFKDPDYLPPENNQQSYQTTKENKFKGSDYLPPTANNQQSYQSGSENQFKVPDFLPPSKHNTIAMYPLSNYMGNIKPTERYGNRRPFPEYGPPPEKTSTFFNSNDIAPMYHQPTTKPQYYAPTMSYNQNAFNTQTTTTFTTPQHQTLLTLSQQTRETLQTFMPEEIRHTTPTNHIQVTNSASKTTTTLPAAKPAEAKIRTVQIVNPNAVKTFKVLESLDDAGVQTLKILGSSNESPTGDHRVVKVVSGSHERSVQTIRIYKDLQDVTTNGNNASTTKRNTTIKSNA